MKNHLQGWGRYYGQLYWAAHKLWSTHSNSMARLKIARCCMRDKCRMSHRNPFRAKVSKNWQNVPGETVQWACLETDGLALLCCLATTETRSAVRWEAGGGNRARRRPRTLRTAAKGEEAGPSQGSWQPARLTQGTAIPLRKRQKKQTSIKNVSHYISKWNAPKVYIVRILIKTHKFYELSDPNQNIEQGDNACS